MKRKIQLTHETVNLSSQVGWHYNTDCHHLQGDGELQNNTVSERHDVVAGGAILVETNMAESLKTACPAHIRLGSVQKHNWK